MGLTVGTHLGGYEILGALGAGGMGEVYRARDRKLNRDVALKILPTEFALDPDRLARFKREAQVLASLDHPNIGAIYGFEDANGVHALVLQLVEGPTLADRISQGAIPIDEALPIARQIAEALEAAHEQGIIHRDLKPANIKVRDDGTVKVLDFGLAKLMEAGEAGGAGRAGSLATQSPTITTPAMTQMGMILGTAAYMSPEQAKGRPADKRSDIWAFGCVLYEMLTGKRAFEGEDVSDTLAAVLRGEPDWSALPASVPPVMGALVRRCLEKDRRRRIGDVAGALFALNEPLIGSTAGSASATVVAGRRGWTRPISALAGIVCVAGLTSAVWWSFRPSAPVATVARFALSLAEGDVFTDPQLPSLAISPDGTQIVYKANRRLYLRSMSDLAERPIPGTEETESPMGNPVFSPDGRSIAFWSGSSIAGTIKRIAVTGGPSVPVCQTDGNTFGMSWDSSGIIFSLFSQSSQGNGIWRVSPTGGTPELLVSTKRDEVPQGPRMLPGGGAVLFTLATTRAAGIVPTSDVWDRAQVVVQSLKSGERKMLNVVGTDARYLSTGHLVYYLRGVLFAVPFAVTRRETTGPAVPVVEGVLRTALGGIASGSAQVAVSDTGSLAYIAGPASVESDRANLVMVDRAGAMENLKLTLGSYERPRVSPDGKHLAFDTDDGRQSIVWIYDLSGATSPRQLTFEGKNRFPIWADNEHVAFQSDRDQDLAIFWQRSDGSTKAERLTRPDQGTAHTPESWSRDGKRFLFTQSKGGTNSLWTFSIQDAKATPFSKVESPRLISPTFSPDDRWVAYTLTNGTTNQVFVEPFPATGAKYLVGTGARPQWTPDGKELFFQRLPQTFVVSVSTQAGFAVGNPTPLPVDVYQGRGPGFGRDTDIMPDGKRFVGVFPATAIPSRTAGARQIQVVLNWGEELKQRFPAK